MLCPEIFNIEICLALYIRISLTLPRLELVFLPPYSPELNLIEGL
jgi:transposase